MGLGSRCRVKRGGGVIVNGEDGSSGLGCVRYTRGLGRKRILMVSNEEASTSSSSSPDSGNMMTTTTPLKRQCSEKMIGLDFDDQERFQLEALPQDILIRVIKGVNHEDLKQLFHVSKSIREAALIAKECHFAYNTPRKTMGFRCSIDFQDDDMMDEEIEAPNAPKRSQVFKSRISEKALADISVELFASPKKRGLFV